MVTIYCNLYSRSEAETVHVGQWARQIRVHYRRFIIEGNSYICNQVHIQDFNNMSNLKFVCLWSEGGGLIVIHFKTAGNHQFETLQLYNFTHYNIIIFIYCVMQTLQFPIIKDYIIGDWAIAPTSWPTLVKWRVTWFSEVARQLPGNIGYVSCSQQIS